MKTWVCLIAILSLAIACDPSIPASSEDAGPVPSEGGPPPPNPPADGGDDGPDAGPVDSGPIPPSVGPCTTNFLYTPAPGQTPKTVTLAGEWNSFSPTALKMNGPNAQGVFTATVDLAPGLIGYKVVVDGAWQLDPGSGLRKYLGGVENSAVRVDECNKPSLSLASKTLTRASAGQGHFAAVVNFQAGKSQPDLDPASVEAKIRKDGVDTTINGVTIDQGQIKVDATSLADGKYSLFVTAKDKGGGQTKPLRLVFWVEAEPFEWKDSLIYMAMVDRFKDGEPSNNAPPTAGVDGRVDFKGGDLQGIKQSIDDGTFDELGVRALWLSPFHKNPAGSFLAADGSHQVMGYHGYISRTLSASCTRKPD